MLNGEVNRALLPFTPLVYDHTEFSYSDEQQQGNGDQFIRWFLFSCHHTVAEFVKKKKPNPTEAFTAETQPKHS